MSQRSLTSRVCTTLANETEPGAKSISLVHLLFDAALITIVHTHTYIYICYGRQATAFCRYRPLKRG